MTLAASAANPSTWTDAHLHVWDSAVLAPPWLAQAPQFAGKFDLARYHAEGGTRGGLVFVEADMARADRRREAELFAEWGDASGLPWASVAGIEPGLGINDEACLAQIAMVGRVRGVTGARRVLHGADIPFSTERFIVDLHRLGSHRLAFDFCIRWTDLAVLEGVLERVEGAKFVLDHLGNPPIRAGWSSAECVEWQRLLARVARHSHIAVKWSAMFENAGRALTADEVRPWFEWCLTCFGPSRMIWGSNWPVCFSNARLTDWIDVCAKLGGELTSDEQAAIFSENARRVYRITERLSA
jgi:L-fuconolactonase